MDEITVDSEVTLMGYGDSWSFDDAQTLVSLLLNHKEKIIHDLGRNQTARDKVGNLLYIIETSDLKLTFSDVVYREEAIDVLEGFDEFVWCSYKGCTRPATYNFKLLKNGDRKGRDDFPASIPLDESDIPYCETHFKQQMD